MTQRRLAVRSADPVVAKSLKYLESFVRKDGGIYQPDSNHVNYETCITIMAFAEANKDGRYTKLIGDAAKALFAGVTDKTLEQIQQSFDSGNPHTAGFALPDVTVAVFTVIVALLSAAVGVRVIDEPAFGMVAV